MKIHWRDISTAPKTAEILVSWGSKASGHMGYSLAKWRFGKWVDHNAQSIEADGYYIVAWMALPNPPL
jgi:hypothetical protein